QCPIDGRDRREAQIAQRRTQSALRQLIGIEHKSGSEAGNDQRQGEEIGQQPAPQVSPREREQPPAEKTVEPHALPAVDQSGGKRDTKGSQLAARIDPPRTLAAITASPAGREPTEDRHEVACAQSGPASLAARPTPSERQTFRQTPDKDTEKAADDRGSDHKA